MPDLFSCEHLFHDAAEMPVSLAGGANDRFPGTPSLALTVEEAWKMLVVDGDPEIHHLIRSQVASFRFEGRPMEVIGTQTAYQAREVLSFQPDIAVVLVDVSRESRDAGLWLVRDIREARGDHRCRIILRTGQPDEEPGRGILTSYDVNDYLGKDQLVTEHFFAALLCALRSFHQSETIEGLCKVLEQRVAQRTAELSEAKNVAERASHAKSAFLAMMSHELRTPLNAILGFSELIRETGRDPAVPPKVGDYAGYVIKAGDHLLQLITLLLDLAKIENGKMEIDPTWFDLEVSIRSAMLLIEERSTRSDITLTCSVEPGAAFLWADEPAVIRSVLNLLSNAVKYTPASGNITVSATVAGNGIAISVADDGCGIPADKLASIFTPYEQMDNRFNRSLPGTGLGLSLVKAMTELHRGAISVESALGRGTKLTLWFPLPDVHEAGLQSTAHL